MKKKELELSRKKDTKFFSKRNWSRDKYLLLMIVPVVTYFIKSPLVHRVGENFRF